MIINSDDHEVMITISLTMDKFVEDQRKFLALEREAEIEESRLLQSNISVRELCQKGVAVQKLVVGNQATGLYGRLVITFVSRTPGNNQELPSHNITSGDIVGLRHGSGQSGSDQVENVSGVVTKVTSSSISVAFSESFEQISFDASLQYSLMKLANDITHKRLTSALDVLSTNPSTAVINVLFGISTPSVPHQSCHPKLLDNDDNLVYFNENLDLSQREAVEFCLKQRELGIVHGPPGTGKTTTVVEIIRQAVKAGDKVLVCAPSNVAVDNLVERLARVKVKVVRLGHPARVSADLQQHSLDAIISSSDEGALVRDIYKELDETLGKFKYSDRRKIRSEVKELRKEIRQREKKALKEILSRAEVVLGTLTSSGPDSPLQHLPEKHFQMTIIDECSQSLEMACWIVASSASKLLLAGDHLQLPPTILSSAASKGLSLTMMERLVKMYQSQVTRMLTIQYRMNEKIMKWSSKAMYEGQLTAGDSVKDHKLSQLSGVENNEVTNTVLLLVDTAGCDMGELTTAENISKANEGEAAIVYHHVNELVDQGVNIEDIAVVTPYNLQVELLRLNMRPKFPTIEIKSVDGYQGREKEVVVLSLVRSNLKKEVGFLGETRRLNVAVTRARRQLIVVCDSDTVKNDKFLKEFIEYLEVEGDVRTADMYQDLPEITRPDGMVLAETGTSVSNTIIKKTASEEEKKKVKESKNSKKTPKESKVVNNKVSKKQDTLTVKKNVINKVEDNEVELDSRRNEYEEILKNFVKSKENFMTFSSDLNSFERRLVHELSEELNLVHESIGEGSKRYIMISKKVESTSNVKALKTSPNKEIIKSNSSKDVEEISKTEGPSTANNNEDPTSITKSATEASKTSSQSVECVNCKKSIPKQNIDLHKLRCVCVVEIEESPGLSKGAKSKKSKKKESKVKSKVKEDGNNDDDFDSLCEQFQKLDKVCNYPKCKVLVATLGVTCKFCGLRFCLNHSMPEVHGCGDEARKAARQQISRDGWRSGTGAINHKPDKDKRAQLEKKLEKRIGDKNEQRQRKKKE